MPLFTLAIVLFFAISGQNPASSAECAAWTACRDAALAAEAKGDFEGFHDLAWRTIQKGPRNNPELMLLLARAQSSSGRPLDAAVMLRRVAAMGVTADTSGEAFARVRALPGWAELERQLSANPTPGTGTATGIDQGATEAIAPAAAAAETNRDERASKPESAGGAPAADTLRFSTPAFTPGGLAYDAVSRRFIVGDRGARKLTVVDEFSHQIANLAGAQATGFGEIGALEIDPREGNLWVVTADAAGASTGATTLHKLQLISARALSSFKLPDGAGAARLTDVAITQQGTVLALDVEGRRMFRLRPSGKALELAAPVGDVTPLSLAPAPGDVVYVSHDAGIQRLDLAGRGMSAVEAAADISLAGLARIRWHGRTLVGIQRSGSGYRAVRLQLSRNGRKVTGIEVLDPAVEAASPEATCISGDGLFYLVPGGSSEMVVRRVELKEAVGSRKWL